VNGNACGRSRRVKKMKYIARRPIKGNTRPHVRSWSAPLIRSLSPSAMMKATQDAGLGTAVSRRPQSTAAAPADDRTFHEIVYTEEDQVGYLSFDFNT